MADRPNIIFIFPDQQRGDTVGFSGNTVVKTPNLDRLATESVTFSRSICNAPICMSARMSLMTGLPVCQHGMWANNISGDPTLPNHVRNIRDAGYYTGQIGKVHLGVRTKGDGHTSEHAHKMHAWGWDYSHELRDITAYVHADCYYTDFLEERGHLHLLRDPISTYMNGETQGKLHPWETPPSLLPDDEDIDMYTARKAIEFIEGYEQDQPFYLQVNFPGPHNPFDSPASSRALYNPDDMPRAILDETIGPISPQVQRQMTGSRLQGLKTSQEQLMRLYYYAKVTHIDEGIGQLVDALTAKGLMDNTWIIYTSDHGEMLGDHHCSHKSVFYESALHIPLLIRPPGGTKGWRSSALTDQFDLVDTMLEIAEAPVLQDAAEYRTSLVSKVMDGEGASEAQKGKDVLFSEVRLFSMVRNDRYKLSVDSVTREPTELYDMVEDPREVHNRVEDPELAHVRTELLEKHLGGLLDTLNEDKLKTYQDALADNPNRGTVAAHVEPAK